MNRRELSIYAGVLIGALLLAISIYMCRKASRKTGSLKQIQEYYNENPYTPSWPKVKKMDTLHPTAAQTAQLRKYLSSIYIVNNLGSNSDEELWSYYLALTIYYNPDGECPLSSGYYSWMVERPERGPSNYPS